MYWQGQRGESVITIEEYKGIFKISSSKEELDIPFIQNWLIHQSYWAAHRSPETIVQSIENSLCIGLYAKNEQIGFARLVTDCSTFAWLCDVFVTKEYQSQGLGKWMIRVIAQHPIVQSLKIFLLGTRDAHGLYREYADFGPIAEPARWMIRK